MTCNLFPASLSNMIGNVGEARHGQVGTGNEVVTTATSAGRTVAAAWSRAGRDRAACRGNAYDGVAVERPTRGRRHGSAQKPTAGPALGAHRRAASRVDAGAYAWGPCRGLSHGSMDAAARRPADRTPLRPLVQREPGLAHPRRARLLLPATLGPSARARRGRDQALEADSLASSKKTLQNTAGSSSSSTSR